MQCGGAPCGTEWLFIGPLAQTHTHMHVHTLPPSAQGAGTSANIMESNLACGSSIAHIIDRVLLYVKIPGVSS